MSVLIVRGAELYMSRREQSGGTRIQFVVGWSTASIDYVNGYRATGGAGARCEASGLGEESLEGWSRRRVGEERVERWGVKLHAGSLEAGDVRFEQWSIENGLHGGCGATGMEMEECGS